MRSVPSAVTSWRQSGRTVARRDLVWIKARDSAGAIVAGGFWSGWGDRAIDVVDPASGATVTRTYHGAGSLLEVEPPTHSSGLDIVPLRISLSPIDATVENLARGYDLRQAEVEVHRLHLDQDTRAPLAAAQVWFTGRISKAPITTPAAGGQAQLTCEIEGIFRDLTVANPETLSDDAQKRRSGDRILKYVAAAASREIAWGGEVLRRRKKRKRKKKD